MIKLTAPARRGPVPRPHGRVRSALNRRGRGHRVRAVPPVAALDHRSSAGSSGRPTPGIRWPGEFGARPFIWGTLYSSILALVISTPIALGIAIFISELCPDWLRWPLVFLTELLAAIPSIVYGLWGIFVLVPVVRQLEVATPDWLQSVPLFSGPPLGVGMLSAALDPGDHGHSLQLVGGARSAEGGAAGAARGRLRARRDALGSDPDGALLCAHRHRRRGHARVRPRAGRDDGGDDGDWQQPADLAGRCTRRSTRWRRSSPTSSPKRPTISICMRSSRSGSCCSSSRSSSTCISRVFIWSMAAQQRTARVAPAAALQGGRVMRDRYRRGLSHLIVGLCGLAVLVALVPLALILFYVLTQGITSLNWAFLTEMPAPVGEAGGGMANAIVGSLIVSGLGALFAIPIGIISGIYAAEYAGTRLASSGALCRRHAQRRSVDRHWRVRLRHRRAAVPAVLGAWPAAWRSGS